ncbi:pentatricopeptide repeat-containing protein At4g02750-like [Selaginella moellendorffii]|uniref:pentatricopeptide repeat-containing protein At4g02750-like n=1 Tax=Selaginella moellendorffii TaxID=88036 RepID=UPI000D1C8AD5|nr:pentatricopeptide repeat-containing protein At4g02750-like [Selaginella moellendorffii]|eukprot:XP_024540460.1 pentatricopeptide repeat-containing protein At4g02750-like [Selaginella moellendorffii]
MITAYLHDSQVKSAKSLFNQTPPKNPLLYNVMLTTYAHNGCHALAIELFTLMLCRDLISYNAMLSALVNSSPIDQTKDFFDLIPEKIVAWNTMLTTYAENGHLEMAISMFDSMSHHDIVSYTAMVTAYGSSGQIEHARILFASSLQKDVVLSTAMLAAYAHLGFLAEASTIFESMRECSIITWNYMLDAHELSRKIEKTQFIFDLMPVRDTVSWILILNAYARLGHLEKAISFFATMPMPHAVPDRVVPWNTMLAAHGTSGQDAENLLWAANLQGVAPDAGWSYFVSMRSDYSIQPEKLHFGCMVAILARAGNFDFARDLLDNMPFVPGIEQLSCLTLF